MDEEREAPLDELESVSHDEDEDLGDALSTSGGSLINPTRPTVGSAT